LVFGAGVTLIGLPATTKPANVVPAALVLNEPGARSIVVLTARTAAAFTRPPSALACWVAALLAEAGPSAVACEAALVVTVPVLSSGGTLTEAMLLVSVTPVRDTQPSVDSAERPERTAGPTVTKVP